MLEIWNTPYFEEKKLTVYTMFKICSHILLNKLIKCNIQRLAVRYDHYSAWGVATTHLNLAPRLKKE